MADETTGTSSTPTADSTATATTASADTTTTATASTSTAASTTGSQTATQTDTQATQTTTQTAEVPLFTLPEDFKPPEGAVPKFTEFLKAATRDGKLDLKPQQVVDLYVGLANDATQAWQAEIERVNTANEAACKKGFTEQELAAAESAVGWFTSRFDKTFRDDYARRQLNDPNFVRLMSLIHEAYIAEDSLEPANRGGPGPDKRPLLQRAQEKLYGGKTN